MVSIVMPTYNGGKYIAKAIESVLNQTYQDFELVIVNDASTDNTLEIIEKYAESDYRIKIITNKENEKLPKSLNTGFKLCQGEYFTWTSDDNLYLPQALEKMIAVLESDRDIDFVYTREKFINEDGKIIGERAIPKDLDDLYSRNIISACFMYKKEVHINLEGYDEEKFLVEDYDFFLRAYMKYKFKYISESLYLYREHSGSLTATKREQVKVSTIEMLKNILLETNDKKIESKIKKGISNYYFDLSDIYFNDVKRLGYRKDLKDLIMKKIRVILVEIIK